ncbi:hypothetical protein CAPTEDRAFT_194545 [Capitella teleta]|uniref:Uncharacterized protein n=1 Tax=Capitella teleta TaxID=283909 RepID=R7UKC5_CAPTE|nr:hypothetical protein CAPTEDRAFT_194545 [Capitella teleta]|eukprot:ELU04258.1 hypothetical protein CAPTEDRAFT_194545 [Capitella teleta]
MGVRCSHVNGTDTNQRHSKRLNRTIPKSQANHDTYLRRSQVSCTLFSLDLAISVNLIAVTIGYNTVIWLFDNPIVSMAFANQLLICGFIIMISCFKDSILKSSHWNYYYYCIVGCTKKKPKKTNSSCAILTTDSFESNKEWNGFFLFFRRFTWNPSQ